MQNIEVSTEIIDKIKKMLPANLSPSVRIFVQNGCEGAVFRLFIDEANANDIVELHDGLRIIVEKSLLEACEGFTITAAEMNGETYLQIQPNKEYVPPQCGGSCCSSCSSCG